MFSDFGPKRVELIWKEIGQLNPGAHGSQDWHENAFIMHCIYIVGSETTRIARSSWKP